MSTFGDLYTYLRRRMRDVLVLELFSVTRQFCEEKSVDEDELIRFVMAWGAYCDSEVLLNLPGRVPQDAEIGVFNETPDAWAARNGMYCRIENEIWMSCEENEKGAILDRNSAIIQMFEEGVAGP